MRKSSFLLTLLVISGCQKGSPPPQQPSASVLPVPQERPADKKQQPYTLTEAKLTAFFDYQRKVLGLYAPTTKDLARLDAHGDGGVAPAAQGAEEVLDEVDKRAQAEARARAEAALTEEDVQVIGQMVSDVFAKRALARALDHEGMLAQLQKMKEGLPAEAREGVEKSIAEMRAQQEERARLAEERAKYGDANVELLLRREEELARNWEALLSQTGEKTR
ncbi:MAG: hypothetical protein ACOZIN_06280 [Myxococcota bacterium]